MRPLVLAAMLLTSFSAQACDLSLVAPAKSALKKPLQVKASLADGIMTTSYSVTAPSLNATKVFGPGQDPYPCPTSGGRRPRSGIDRDHSAGQRLERGAEDSSEAPRLGWRPKEDPREFLFYSRTWLDAQLLEHIPATSQTCGLSSAAVFSNSASMRIEKTRMKRRDFLQISGALSAHVIVGGSLLSIHKAEAQAGLPIAALRALLDPKKDMVLVPTNKDFSKYNRSFNTRTQIAPRVRVVAGSAKAVSTTMLWAANNGLSFAVRSGGHSYEGFSQSPDLVIDVRGMTGIKLATDKKSVSVGSGSSLGSVYKALWPGHLAIPAGSCFPVGVAGHSLGGGFGLLGRPFGLACDSILSMEVVDASGNILNVSDKENSDLFWALRGGGNGSFGVVTNFNFRTSAVNMVAKFAITWNKPVAQGVKIVQAWQEWLEDLPSSVTCTLHLTKAKGGLITVHMAGLSVQSESGLKVELKRLQSLAGTASVLTTRTMTFHQAAVVFDGGETNPDSVLMKAKSDYVTEPMTGQGILTL